MNKSTVISLTPVLLIILNFILKIVFIESNSIGGDEPFSIYYAQLDVPYIVQHLSAGNNPPLYELILHYWIKLFGISELAVRFPSLLFSVATVFFIYRICISFFNYPIALTASLLFTFSNYHLAFSHEARVYSLFALLTTASMYVMLLICNGKQYWKHYFLLAAINTLLLYAHYFGFFVIAIQTISVLAIEEIRTKTIKAYSIYLCGVIILYIPNIQNLLLRFLDSSANGTWVSPPNGMESIYNMLWQFSNKPVTTIMVIGVLLTALVKLIINKDIHQTSVNSKIILIWFALPFCFMFMISYWIPMFIDRYLIFASVGFYILLSICSNYIIANKKYQLILPGIMVLLFIATFNINVDNKRHVKETIAKLNALTDQETKVLVCPQSFIYNFAYYDNPEIFKSINNQHPDHKITELLNSKNIYTINNIQEVDLTKCKRIIYLDAAAAFSCPDNNILNTLQKTYTLKNTYPFYEIFNVYEFVK